MAQPPGGNGLFSEPGELRNSSEAVRHSVEGDSNGIPRPKRIACVICRKRKLRCDGGKPSCGTCRRLGHDCSYDEVRRKSGPKRGYVKQLEARLGWSGPDELPKDAQMMLTLLSLSAQVETLLKTQDTSGNTDRPVAGDDLDFSMLDQDGIPSMLGDSETFNVAMPQPSPEAFNMSNELGYDAVDSFSWELISQGVEEPLPCQEVIDEL